MWHTSTHSFISCAIERQSKKGPRQLLSCSAALKASPLPTQPTFFHVMRRSAGTALCSWTSQSLHCEPNFCSYLVCGYNSRKQADTVSHSGTPVDKPNAQAPLQCFCHPLSCSSMQVSAPYQRCKVKMTASKDTPHPANQEKGAQRSQDSSFLKARCWTNHHRNLFSFILRSSRRKQVTPSFRPVSPISVG